MTPHKSSSPRDYLRILRRRKWAILQAVVIVPVVAFQMSRSEQALYEAKSEVLLSRQNVAALLTGTLDPSSYQQPERVAQTQARIAAVPEVAERTLRATGLSDRSPDSLLSNSIVSADPNTDLLEFRVRDTNETVARRLATEYANQFTIYRSELDTAAIVRARKEVKRRIRQLAASGDRRSTLYTSLVDKDQQLETMETLQTSNASLLREADSARKVRPRPVRNALLGVILGLGLGLAIALLLEALDTRVRSDDEIVERLRLPLLGRIPKPPRKQANQLVMLSDPDGIEAETFRMLRANLEFVNLEPQAKTIMFTSATQEEGKSTTVANLAVALARAGRRVVLVDLDFRRPSIERFFRRNGTPGTPDAPGVTDVAVGDIALGDALMAIPLVSPGQSDALGARRDARMEGTLHILATGPLPPNAGEFIGSQVLSDILKKVGSLADIVLIDSPPMLHVGDAMTLSATVDALVVVTRLRVVRRPMLNELLRALDTSRAFKLGFVLTGVSLSDTYREGYYHESRNGGRRTRAFRTRSTAPEQSVEAEFRRR
jgi:polysaccharide biosynthesis transport protein